MDKDGKSSVYSYFVSLEWISKYMKNLIQKSFFFWLSTSFSLLGDEDELEYVRDGDIVRLQHVMWVVVMFKEYFGIQLDVEYILKISLCPICTD